MTACISRALMCHDLWDADHCPRVEREPNWVLDTCGRPGASEHEGRHRVCLSIPSTPDFWWFNGQTLASPSWSVKLPCGGWEWRDRSQVADLLSSWGPGTTGCSILGMSRWWPALWLPSSARHRRLAGGPAGCFWSGSWCTDGWAEAVAGKQCPPRPRQCRWPGSCPVDSASAGQSLWVVVAVGDSRRSKTEVLEAVFLDDVTFVLDLDSRCFWVNVTDDPAILSACLMIHTRFWRTLGSGPSTWEPSNGAVLTVDRTWGWYPNFFSKTSRRNSWRLIAAAKPADTAETWASWIMASFSLRSFVLSSLGESSSMTDATMESAREA